MGSEKKELYRYETRKNWDELYQFYLDNFTCTETKWLFRGDNPDPWCKDCTYIPDTAFKSRLEKAFKHFDIKNENERRKTEQKIIRDFRRKAPLYTNYRLENWLECLGLIQHYEGPTRMLDWTYSFFAAVYFAINRAEQNSCVVWALDNNWLELKNKKLEENYIKEHSKDIQGKLKQYREDGKGWFENFIIQSFINRKLHSSSDEYNVYPFIYAVNPYYLNARLSIQQGVLLCPSKISINTSWSKNLEIMLRNSIEEENDNQNHLWKIRIELENVEI